MGLDKAKADAALLYTEALNQKLDTVINAIDSERAESGRRFDVHSQAIINKATETIETKFVQLGSQLEERIDLRFRAFIAEQEGRVAASCEDIETMKGDLASLDRRTIDFPQIKQKVEYLESRPGQFAIKAWQKVAAVAGSFIVVAASILPWIFPKKG
jgi:hypothetical protein